MTQLSIVVPSFNESTNVLSLTSALDEVLIDIDYEIVFVDDSTDSDSINILQELARAHRKVTFIHRDNERGLGTAVVRGLEVATGEFISVMDADMQHPPVVLLDMLAQMEQGYDIVIPSRFVPGGDDGGLSGIRKLISWTARLMGKFALKHLRKISDPTSGYFMFRRECIEEVQLRPIGWKILIEILVRGNYSRVIEIPYRFQSRAAGESHMSLKEQWNYCHHLLRLMKDSPEDRRLYLFALVGLSGVVVNMLFYILLYHLGLSAVLSSLCSGAIALVTNYILNDQLTWRDSRQGYQLLRFAKYAVTSLVGIGINAFIVDLWVNVLVWHYIVANFIGIASATVWNYLVNNLWTWKRMKKSLPSITLSKHPLIK